MKIGCELKNVNSIFSKYECSAKQLKELLNPKNLSNIPKFITSGNLYQIDYLCMRTRFQTNFKIEINNNNLKHNTIPNRFFECEECSKYKIYKEMVELDSVADIETQIYSNLSLKVEVLNNRILSDFFTNLILVNQYLFSQDGIFGIEFISNAFRCGDTGYIYFTKDDPGKVEENIYNKIIDLVKLLSKYNFSFNSMVDENLFLYKSSSGEGVNVYLRIPKDSSVTTLEHKIRIREHKHFDVLIPGKIEEINEVNGYFTFNLSKPIYIDKFKYLRANGKLDEKVNNTLNALLLYLGFIKKYKGVGKEIKEKWNLFWYDSKDAKIEDFILIENFDSLLSKISGLKMKYIALNE